MIQVLLLKLQNHKKIVNVHLLIKTAKNEFSLKSTHIPLFRSGNVKQAPILNTVAYI